jgi:pseudaminic acid synthase
MTMQDPRDITIAGRTIGAGHPPFIIAEMSGNHNHSLERALAIVEAASRAGAHAVKLQTYTADTLTIDVDRDEFIIHDEKSLWKDRSLYKLYQEAHTPWGWHRPIMDRCRELGIICFSTPFDETAVDFLEELNVPAYKIASFENTHLPLIRRVAATGKPLFISTGMATEEEIDEALNAAIEAGGNDIVLLKCTSTYPATPESTNILTIPHMSDQFGVPVGLSDHTLGIGVAVASVALGAVAIEKHFTLRRADGGVDASFSMEPEELQKLVIETKQAWQALGCVSYGPTESEKASLKFRRSIYAVKNMKAGEFFTKDTIRVIRPGNGLAPKHLDSVLGKRASREIKRGTPVTWELLESDKS